MSSYRAILIAGPTAGGKSGLAERLAEHHRGAVINADSMQVYSDLEILTARPERTSVARLPHSLYGHVDGGTAYSVGQWLGDARSQIETCVASGLVPIIVGGTGLYFKALLEGLSPIPAIPDMIRMHWRAEALRLDAPALHAVLARLDPLAARQLRPSDAQRVTRALEVLEATGRSLVSWQQEPGISVLAAGETLRLVVEPPRVVLYDRAERRFDEMIARGALGEVRQLMARQYAADLPVMRAIGVRPLIGALAGRMAVEEAVAQAKIDTRRYIKRQQTWLKRNMIAWRRVELEEMERIALENFTFMRG